MKTYYWQEPEDGGRFWDSYMHPECKQLIAVEAESLTKADELMKKMKSQLLKLAKDNPEMNLKAPLREELKRLGLDQSARIVFEPTEEFFEQKSHLH